MAFNLHCVESWVDGGFVEVLVFIAFVDLVWSRVRGVCHLRISLGLPRVCPSPSSTLHAQYYDQRHFRQYGPAKVAPSYLHVVVLRGGVQKTRGITVACRGMCAATLMSVSPPGNVTLEGLRLVCWFFSCTLWVSQLTSSSGSVSSFVCSACLPRVCPSGF